MEKELGKLLNEYSYDEIVQAINSIVVKKKEDRDGQGVVHS